jgi:hypothetical protein
LVSGKHYTIERVESARWSGDVQVERGAHFADEASERNMEREAVVSLFESYTLRTMSDEAENSVSL